jgi:hypothetical protein
MMENTALRHDRVGAIFQSDGAPPHFSRPFRAFLYKEFPDRWIGRGGLFTAPPPFSRFDCSEFFMLRNTEHIRNFVMSSV